MMSAPQRRATWQHGDRQPQLQQTKKTVRFSQNSTMMHVRIPSQREISRRWYTREQEVHFQHLMYADAMRQSTVYLAAKERDPNAILPREEIDKCVGVVHLLSEDVRARYQEYKESRMVHADIVLKEQDRQRELGRRCETLLAGVSKLSSKASRDRAVKVALLSAGATPNRRSSC